MTGVGGGGRRVNGVGWGGAGGGWRRSSTQYTTIRPAHPPPPHPHPAPQRYFHAKQLEGLLSSSGLRVLDFCCDCCLDAPEAPLDIWCGRAAIVTITHARTHAHTRPHTYGSGPGAADCMAALLLPCMTLVVHELMGRGQVQLTAWLHFKLRLLNNGLRR